MKYLYIYYIFSLKSVYGRQHSLCSKREISPCDLCPHVIKEIFATQQGIHVVFGLCLNFLLQCV